MSVPSVLLCDDDQKLVRALAIRCKSLGMEVTTAFDAVGALTSIVTTQPDALVLDINMPPHSTGLALCRRLNESHLTRIPTIIMTGRWDEETLSACEALEVKYLWKSSHLWEDLKPALLKVFQHHPDMQKQVDASRA